MGSVSVISILLPPELERICWCAHSAVPVRTPQCRLRCLLCGCSKPTPTPTASRCRLPPHNTGRGPTESHGRGQPAAGVPPPAPGRGKVRGGEEVGGCKRGGDAAAENGEVRGASRSLALRHRGCVQQVPKQNPPLGCDAASVRGQSDICLRCVGQDCGAGQRVAD